MKPPTPRKPTLTSAARALFRPVLARIGERLHRWGVHPDAVSIVGVLLVGLAALLIAQGHLQPGGLLLVLALPLDAVDGAVARAMQREDHFGALLDSTLDRYADGFIFLALSYHFAVQERLEPLVLVLLALLGSLLVSYVRARAEGLGVAVSTGWFTRLERLLVLVGGLLFPGLLDGALLLLALGTHVTVWQRVRFVYRRLQNRGD